MQYYILLQPWKKNNTIIWYSQLLLLCIISVVKVFPILCPQLPRFVLETQLHPLAPSCGHSTGPCGLASLSPSMLLLSSSPCMSGTAHLGWRHVDATGTECFLSPQHSTCAMLFSLEEQWPSSPQSAGLVVCWWTFGPSSVCSVCPPTLLTWLLSWSGRKPMSNCQGYMTQR